MTVDALFFLAVFAAAFALIIAGAVRCYRTGEAARKQGAS